MMVVMVHYDRNICQHASEELKKTNKTSSYNWLPCVQSLKHVLKCTNVLCTKA